MTLTLTSYPMNLPSKKHFANMPVKTALVCLSQQDSPRMAELLSERGPISMRAKNNRGWTPAWLGRTCGLLAPHPTGSSSFRMTTNHNITVKKWRVRLINKFDVWGLSAKLAPPFVIWLGCEAGTEFLYYDQNDEP